MELENKENPLIDNFLSHLFDCRDIDNLIIKGHILTEHALHFFIEMSAIEKVDFKKIKFTYSNKIEIAKLFGLFKKHPKLYNELRQLNKLRNSIAHRLKYDEKLLSEFLKGFDNYKTLFKSQKLNQLEIGEEVFYESGNEKITVDGSHMMLMFYISAVCMTIFQSIDRNK
nr:hypothetical protein [uncultured Lacinutrix sp.]